MTNDMTMQLTDQTTADLTMILDKIDQRVHEMTCDKDAVNAANPAEVATLADLGDEIRVILG